MNFELELKQYASADKQSLERTISEAYRCLKNNGLIICLGPNIKFVPGGYYDHHIPLTELSLSELLRMKGFTIDVCIPRFLPYSMSTGKTPPLFLLRLYLKIPKAWSILGKQFLVIGLKETREKGSVDQDGEPHP